MSTKCLNYRNINGFTPLHLACQADKPDCVKELLVCGADVNIPAGIPVTNVSENKLPGIVKEYLQDNHKKLFVEVRKTGKSITYNYSKTKHVYLHCTVVSCYNINYRV